MKPRAKVRPLDELAVLASERRVATINRLARRQSVASDLLTILEGPLSRTVEHLLGGLAVLSEMTAATQGAVTDVERRGSGEAPLPSFKSAWADRRASQIDRVLWELGESVENFVNRPHDPDNRQGFCGKCGVPSSQGDVCCRQCGSRLGVTPDQRLTARVYCFRRSCDLFKRTQPKWFRAGRDSWVQNWVCQGDGGECKQRLRDA